VHSADGWDGVLKPVVARYQGKVSRIYFRADAAKRGTCEQWIKEGKGAIKWTRLSCRTFAANAVRLQLHALVEPIKDWSLTTLKDKLIKIGAKVVSQAAMLSSRWPSGQHLASVLQEGREKANIDAGLGFIWGISGSRVEACTRPLKATTMVG
jgi:hypothetical protein